MANGRRHAQRLAPEIEQQIWEAEQRRLEHLRQAKELTRAKVAERLGLSRRGVAKVLRRLEREREHA